MVYNIISYWLIGMALGYYLTFNMQLGPSGMWMGMIAGLTAGAILMGTRFLLESARRIRVAQSP